VYQKYLVNKIFCLLKDSLSQTNLKYIIKKHPQLQQYLINVNHITVNVNYGTVNVLPWNRRRQTWNRQRFTLETRTETPYFFSTYLLHRSTIPRIHQKPLQIHRAVLPIQFFHRPFLFLHHPE